MKTRIAAIAAAAILTLPALTACFGGDDDCDTNATAAALAKPGGGSGGKGGGSKAKPKSKPKGHKTGGGSHVDTDDCDEDD